MSNNNTQKSNKIINLIIISFLIIILLIGIYYIINKTNLIIHHEKDVNTYKMGKGNYASKYLDLCKKGCVRGTCKKSDEKDSCKYDFQCNYCKDRDSSQFYVDLTNYEEVLPDYDLQEELSKNQSEDLNDEIKKNNEYIDDINKKIREYNGI